MERWSGKIAVVTGVSSGIGLCIARTLYEKGMIVIGISRRIDHLENLQKELQNVSKESKNATIGEFHFTECDVTNPESVKIAFNWIEQKFHKIHVLINNAGIFKYTGILTENNEMDLKEILDTNFMGTIYCTKCAYELIMKYSCFNEIEGEGKDNEQEKEEEYHIINMNSILGHYAPVGKFSTTYNVYPSSKFAVRAATEVLRQELLENKNFRISNISPGLVKTDIASKAGHPAAERIMKTQPILMPEDVANTICFVLGAPKHVQIAEIIIIPVGQKF